MPDALLGAMQWPVMAVTLFAAWLLAAGFWWFIASNVLKVARALLVLQVGLLA